MLLAVLVSVATPRVPGFINAQAEQSVEQQSTDDALRTQEIDEGIQGSERWLASLAQAAAEFDVPLAVLQAVMSIESGGDPARVAASGDGVGLMQVRQDIVNAMAEVYGDRIFNPSTNIRIAANYLSRAHDQFGNWDFAYAAYSGAIGLDRSTPAERDPADFGNVARFRWALGLLGFIESQPHANGTALDWAFEALGAPYVWSGKSLDGFDCSGLVYWAYQMAGVTLPPDTWGQWAVTTRITGEELQPGDLIFFGADLYHVGLYAGNGYMLHAPTEGKTVEIVSLSETHWSANIAGYGRVP